jgi:hypothetical protein
LMNEKEFRNRSFIHLRRRPRQRAKTQFLVQARVSP